MQRTAYRSARLGARDEIRPNPSRAYQLAKRGLDIALSAAGLALTAPVMLLAALAIELEDPGGAVFYHQERIGRNGVPFTCHKLRSMREGADREQEALRTRNEMDGPAFKMRRDPRVTRVGRILRKLSIDELPQLYNVLAGDMSLVGPRPLPVAEALKCSAYQRQRELVRPGLTCYWQIYGRNRVPFGEWMEMDMAYIRAQNLRTDLKILFETIPAVLRGGGC